MTIKQIDKALRRLRRILFIGGPWNGRVRGFEGKLNSIWNVVAHDATGRWEWTKETYSLQSLQVFDPERGMPFRFEVYIWTRCTELERLNIARHTSFADHQIDKAWRDRIDWVRRQHAAHPVTRDDNDDPERHRDIEYEIEQKHGDKVEEEEVSGE